MLLIPITGKISWRNPPIVTIAFILINVLVFFIFQYNDDRYQYEAGIDYFDSGLSEIEIPIYLKTNRPQFLPADLKLEEMNKEALFRTYIAMEQDFQFQERIRNRSLLPRDNPGFAEWNDLRKHYESILSRIVSLNYGFRPAYQSLVTVFTYMFLHGGFGHLLGNMVFLWLVGCLLEMGCGRLFCMISYLVTGIASALFFWLFNMDSIIPLVGASGSISGLMGAFAVMFGKNRVKIFYSLGFYFNYIAFPAIMLFPVWVGNELVQLLFGAESHVAYLAHLGGLLSGGLLGFANRKLFGDSVVSLVKEDPAAEILPIMEKALQRVGVLDMEGGRKLLEEVLQKDPHNCEALVHLFNIDKLDPQGQRFHLSAKRLMTRLCLNKKDHGKVWDMYQEYTRLAKPPKLSPEIYVRLSSVFAGLGKLENAEQIMAMLLKKKPDLQGIPAGLMHIAAACRSRGDKEKWKRYLQLLCKQYQTAPEAAIAADLIRSDTKKIEL